MKGDPEKPKAERPPNIPADVWAKMANWERAVARGKYLRDTGEMGPDDGRNRKRTSYMKKAIMRFLNFTPAQLIAYEPKNYFEVLAKQMLTKSGTKEGEMAVKTWKEIKETLGERIGSNWKETQEHADDKPDIVNDLPTAAPKVVN